MSSPEDIASDILRCHYEALSQDFHHPIDVAQILFQEEVLSDMTNINSGQSDSERRTVFLKAIRSAVHINHHNLALFSSILKRFTENVPIANAIFNDYG